MQVLASQLHFLANRNAGLGVPPLFWPVSRIKIGGHVALLSDPTVNCLYCDTVLQYLIQQLVNLASQVDTQYSKFGNVIRNIQNKLGNRDLKSD